VDDRRKKRLTRLGGPKEKQWESQGRDWSAALQKGKNKRLCVEPPRARGSCSELLGGKGGEWIREPSLFS